MQTARLDLAPVVALLGSVAIIVLGNGLLGTLLGVRAVAEGFSAASIGLFMSGYFVGYVAGAWHGPALIARSGHVRSFAAFASVASTTTLVHAVLIDEVTWTALRVVNGYCYAGMIMIAESWLNGHALKSTRGRLLAVYGSLMMAAWGASQFFLVVAEIDSFILFSLASVFLSLGLVPLMLARATIYPSEIAPVRMGLGRLYRVSPLGTVGVFVSGLGMTAFWAMGAPYAREIGHGDFEISLFMAVTMFGGLSLQWPIGWLSDRLDRRGVIIAAGAVTALAAAALALFGDDGLLRLVPLAFLFGGVGVTIYSLCVAHSNDYVDERDLLPLASSLTLLYGAGGALGPLIAGQAMGWLGPAGLFAYLALLQLGFVGFGLYRVLSRPPLPAAQQASFVAVPAAQTPSSHMAVQLDPRGADAATAEAKGA
jgi:MFS family permease